MIGVVFGRKKQDSDFLKQLFLQIWRMSGSIMEDKHSSEWQTSVGKNCLMIHAQLLAVHMKALCVRKRTLKRILSLTFNKRVNLSLRTST